MPGNAPPLNRGNEVLKYQPCIVERVVQTAKLPVLLVRVKRQAEDEQSTAAEAEQMERLPQE
jgi:hypothetical protein